MGVVWVVGRIATTTKQKNRASKPYLSPPELKVLVPGENLLDFVVGALNEHVLEPASLVDVCLRRRVPKRVCPRGVGGRAEAV